MRSRSGFTLLEVMVATLIMGIAVAGLIGGLSQSVKNAARLSDYDRAAMLARTQMNELLADSLMPLEGVAENTYDPSVTNGVPSGWHAEWNVFEAPPKPTPGTFVLERIQVDVWWQPLQGTRRVLHLEGFKKGMIPFPPPGSRQ